MTAWIMEAVEALTLSRKTGLFSGKSIEIGKWWDGGKQGNIMVKGKPKNIKGSNFFDLANRLDALWKPDNFSSFSYRNSY